MGPVIFRSGPGLREPFWTGGGAAGRQRLAAAGASEQPLSAHSRSFWGLPSHQQSKLEMFDRCLRVLYV